MSSNIRYVTREEMEAVSPGLYEAVAPQFRDRLASQALASPQNAEIFRAMFSSVPEVVDALFERVGYVEETEWPMWKLVTAFYVIQAQLGPQAVVESGKQIYATMPWPEGVRSIADALRFTTIAYTSSHFLSPVEIVGCWRVEREERGHIVLVDDTPYPCFVNEGVVAGICQAFAKQSPSYTIAPNAKRDGGTVTSYSVRFTPV